MKIGIIGSGNIGRTLAKHLAKVGHEVSISNSRGAASLAEFAATNQVKAVEVTDAARNNEMVIIAIPQKSILTLSKDLFEGVSDEVIIVDTCNYYPTLRDGEIDLLEDGLSDSEWVSQMIGKPVLKAFNSIQARSLMDEGHAKGDPKRIALAVSGDNAAHKQVLANVLDQIGFDFYDNGLLSNSWKQQPGTPTYCVDFNLEKISEAMDSFCQEVTADIKALIQANRATQEQEILAGHPISIRGIVE